MKKTHDIRHLPTDDVDIETHLLFKNRSNKFSFGWNRTLSWKAQHLHILSDEEIKEGDWCTNGIDIEFIGEKENNKMFLMELREQCFQKIIATTDKSLIVSWEGHEPYTAREINAMVYLPQIPQSLVKAYAEAGGFDKVELEYEIGELYKLPPCEHDNKEVYKRDDKLKLKDNEVVWSRVANDCSQCNQTIVNCECHIPDEVKHKGLHDMCKDLAGETMYSREEVEAMINDFHNRFCSGTGTEDLKDDWIKDNLR